MKPSHLTTPRTLNECNFTPGYVSCRSGHGAPLWERIADVGLAVAIGLALAYLLAKWLST